MYTTAEIVANIEDLVSIPHHQKPNYRLKLGKQKEVPPLPSWECFVSHEKRESESRHYWLIESYDQANEIKDEIESLNIDGEDQFFLESPEPESLFFVLERS